MPRPTDADEKEFLLRALNTATMKLFRDEGIYFQPLDDLGTSVYDGLAYAMEIEGRTEEWDEVQAGMRDQLSFSDPRGKALLALFSDGCPFSWRLLTWGSLLVSSQRRSPLTSSRMCAHTGTGHSACLRRTETSSPTCTGTL